MLAVTGEHSTLNMDRKSLDHHSHTTRTHLWEHQSDGNASRLHWFALYTLPQNEFTVARKLTIQGIESFLPTFEVIHTWKNRRRMTIAKPVFPTYVFVRAQREQRTRILTTTGAIRMVGSQCGLSIIPDAEINLLRSDLLRQSLEPYRELVIGTRVRIRRGPMQGIEGVLVRKANQFRFVLTVQAIQHSVALEIPGEDLEPVSKSGTRATLTS